VNAMSGGTEGPAAAGGGGEGGGGGGGGVGGGTPSAECGTGLGQLMPPMGCYPSPAGYPLPPAGCGGAMMGAALGQPFPSGACCGGEGSPGTAPGQYLAGAAGAGAGAGCWQYGGASPQQPFPGVGAYGLYGCGAAYGAYPGHMLPMYGGYGGCPMYPQHPGYGYPPQVPMAYVPQQPLPASNSEGLTARGQDDRRGGPQLASMMPGDWLCPKCGDHVFARNSACRRCQTPRPDGAGADGAGGAAGGGGGGGGSQRALPGDWYCPRCKDLQFARNSQCRMCGCAKPDASGFDLRDEQPRQRAGGGGGGGSRVSRSRSRSRRKSRSRRRR